MVVQALALGVALIEEFVHSLELVTQANSYEAEFDCLGEDVKAEACFDGKMMVEVLSD